MRPLLEEFHVHHSSQDGILVQLPGGKGFGRLTVDTLGGDALAERLLKSFATRESVLAVPCRKRDAQGYRLLTVRLATAWSGLLTYPVPVRHLISQLLRKHLLVGLGTTTMAQIRKVSGKGLLLTLPSHMPAVAPFEHLEDQAEDEGDGDAVGRAVEVRLLSYDVANHVAHVTTKADVVQSTPTDTAVLAAALLRLTPGTAVSARVLLSTTDDACAVVEVPVQTADGVTCTVLGYYIYAWNGEDTAKPPVVGSTLQLVAEFVPETTALQELLPFVVLSRRTTFAGLPAVRTEEAAAGAAELGGLVGHLPWREAAHGDAHEGDSEEDADGEDAEAQPRIRRRKLEEAIDHYERTMEETVPTSPEEFQRLLLAHPNSSYLWTQYMAHHVGLHQYEEARQVAEKALSTIGVREQEERLNVWVAYLNIENMAGTAESLASVFKRALRRQLNQLALHERLADIFAASRKPNQLLSLCRTMTSKFRNERRPWERLGMVLVDQDKRDQLKRTIRDLSAALKKDEAALTVVHIAIHEYKHGSIENGRALFEGLLAKSPKKSDIWFTFIDQELALLSRRAPESSVAHVRLLFERAVAMTFSTKVMHQLLARFLSFEKAYGTAADEEKVKARARAYVESKIQSVTDTGVR